MSETYPADIHTHEGWGRVHQGHDLDEAALLADLRHRMEPTATEVATEEVWLHLQRRVKECGRHGDPCDMEGDWHRHWHSVKPSPGAAFTIAYPATEGGAA